MSGAAEPETVNPGTETLISDATEKQEPVLGVNWVIDRTQQTHSFPINTPFRIINHFGDLRLRASGDDQLLVFASVQRFTEDDIKPIIEVDKSGDEVVIEVRFPSSDHTKPDLLPDQVGKRRADLAIVIPGSSPITVSSLNGLVEAKSLGGPLAVKSRSGNIRVLAKNDLNLQSEHGEVDIYFKETNVFPKLLVETLTGDIRVEFPSEINRSVKAETNGHIVTDFSMTVEKDVGSPHKVGHVTLGDGGDLIQLSSNLGMILLLDQPRLLKLENPIPIN